MCATWRAAALRPSPWEASQARKASSPCSSLGRSRTSIKPAGTFPIFHVLRALAGLAECERLETSATLPATIDALIFRTQDAVLALVANPQPRPVTISLPADLTGQRVLDAAHFHIAAQDPAFLDTHAPASGRHLTLTAYAVASLRLRAPCG